MEKEISFSEGIKLTPYGDVSPDGEVSVCNNLEAHGGGLRPTVLNGRKIPIVPPQDVPGDPMLRYIHATGEYTHLIFVTNGEYLSWWNDDGTTPASSSVSPTPITDETREPVQISGVKSISSVGNVLVVTTATETLYAQWRGGSYNDYEWLGALPDLQVTFKLEGTWQEADKDTLGMEKWYDGDVSAENYNLMAAAVERFTEQNCNGEGGKFVHPFLVRAAYRLYDGKTWVKHTAPVLMTPNTNGPILGISYDMNDATIYSYLLHAFVCSLVADLPAIDQKWRDIITGVDIFVSLPLDPWNYTYDATIERSDIWTTATTVWQVTSVQSDARILNLHPQDHDGEYGLYDYRALTFNATGLSNNRNINGLLHLAKKSDKELQAQGETAEFYRLGTVLTEDLENPLPGHAFNMSKGTYQNLMFQTRLPDDFGSRDALGARVSYTYNRRLTLGDLKKTIYVGGDIQHAMNYLTYDAGAGEYAFFWQREKNGEPTYHIAGVTDVPVYAKKLRYLYTPDPYVTHLVIYSQTSGRYARIALKKHPFLTGRYFYDRDSASPEYDSSTTITPQGAPQEEYPSALTTSETDNPFVFGAAGWNQAGNGRVIALATITKALSEGQFGQFPLMALCSDGNYVLEVIKSGELAGLYGASSPMPRDVCVNRESVTQTDGAILYVSNRGVMMADGNDIRCLSASLDGPAEDDLSGEDTYADWPKLRDFFETCKIIWDYTNQRALFYNPDNPLLVQYRDGVWTTQTLGDAITEGINIYPYSYVQDNSSTVTVLDADYGYTSETVPETVHSGTIVTRPIKMDSMQLKKLNEFSLQGVFSESQTVELYGSNDARNWTKMGETTRRRVPHVVGRWYKYWRMVIKTRLTEKEHISGVRMRYDVREETRMR